MKIIFMGTPEFAVPALEILFNSGYHIAGVITSPDKLGGRGRNVLIESAVKKYALSKKLNILQPTNLKSPKFCETLKSLGADLQIVVAFRMLPEMVWNMPKFGTYNLHGSLLPRYRGAAPINWAIINGEKMTGVTSFKLQHEIDTGSILFQKNVPIYSSDNATALHDRMMYVGAETVLETVQAVEKGNVSLKDQDNSLASHAPKLNKENTKIDFNKSTETVYNFIRGLSLYPGAWFELGEKQMKIFKSSYTIETSTLPNGSIESDNRQIIRIKCSDGWLNLLEIQYSGKRKMNVKEFLNGFDISPFLG